MVEVAKYSVTRLVGSTVRVVSDSEKLSVRVSEAVLNAVLVDVKDSVANRCEKEESAEAQCWPLT